MTKYISIRDDDVNALTSPDTLKEVYGFLFDENIPVNFSAVPKLNASAKTASKDFGEGTYEPFIPKDKAGDDRDIPIGENTELVNFLRSLPNAEFLMHGLTHSGDMPDYEFENKDPEVIASKIAEGKRLMKDAFGKAPWAFVAPQDKYSYEALRQIRDNFKLFSLGWVDKYRIPKSLYMKYYLMKLGHTNYMKLGDFLVTEHPGCLFSRFRDHAECNWKLESYLRNYNYTIIVVHHWEFYRETGELDEPLYARFKIKIKELQENSGYEFIGFSQLYEKIMGKPPL